MKTPLIALFAVLTVGNLTPAFAQTALAKWQTLINNKVLTNTEKFEGGNMQILGMNLSSEPGAYITELHLCKDGSFLRVQKVSQQPQNASANSKAVISIRDKVSGTWKFTQTDASSAVIKLKPKRSADLQEGDKTLNLSFDAAYTLIDDERWLREKSPICQ